MKLPKPTFASFLIISVLNSLLYVYVLQFVMQPQQPPSDLSSFIQSFTVFLNGPNLKYLIALVAFTNAVWWYLSRG